MLTGKSLNVVVSIVDGNLGQLHLGAQVRLDELAAIGSRAGIKGATARAVEHVLAPKFLQRAFCAARLAAGHIGPRHI